ncbi:alpha-1,2-fucosyltransferase [Luteolibacter flavescens]|uniref:Alpha-1,2-fucosyltransferase n=1 Tax=Luteolibacter flavescens TaxID=1859460 RepID=A0ABT3FU86_9BACT|nr:alpha-1,2-fucosyltransferase [Luteolibacter flavescens]MCW1887138.1 alpha-1,2-fucosyltransferase [Luteolibacter flavescens]
MRVRVLPSALRDLDIGYEFYERQELGAGDYFIDSISSDIGSLRIFAGIHRKRGDYFRFSSKRFPYWIYYGVSGDTAYVAAVLDSRQNPVRIRDREKDLGKRE